MLLTFLLSVFCRVATSQDIAMPLDPNDPRLSFSFSIQPGVPAFRFKVGLNKAGHVTGVSVSREGESVPFQTLPKCAIIDIPEPVSDNWQAYEEGMKDKRNEYLVILRQKQISDPPKVGQYLGDEGGGDDGWPVIPGSP